MSSDIIGKVRPEHPSSPLIDVLVIGGGASGMLAAISARRKLTELIGDQGQVVILERNDRLGKKLLTTGNGRCNITNMDTDLCHFHGKKVDFAKGPLLRHSPEQIRHFFEDLGLLFVEEDTNKIYPLSLHAASVLDALRLAIAEEHIQVITNAYVTHLDRDQGDFNVKLTDGRVFEADSVIVATGGMAAPKTGSDGDGYSLLENFSHSLVKPLPAIVQLKAQSDFCKPLSGNKIRGQAILMINRKAIRQETGEILFTDYGLSGPPILQLSGYVSRCLEEQSNKKPAICISLDFLPEYSLDQVLSILHMRKEKYSNRNLEEYLTGIFHRRLAYGLLKQAVPKALSSPVADLSHQEICNLANVIKSLEITVTGTMSFTNSQTTAGGIATSDFHSTTMASKLCDGLYACGEVLDIDGDCGGFNLQWAWASGLLAGSSAAKYIMESRIGPFDEN